ncbi:50S ribosomal protein L13 [Candidatus Berkelbacteria bacterium CG10_big_fil_rev_8_21_14_0_10_43_14]|uniref:Large ribosomal subunit protein uL13 n=1 Tax=Candidatus Berkelbacteria bacterium CG10_big_fil_rev_8_21_14_0_10_43_14 TaxID=1974515 RepID=A0A2M6R8R6_9BACT|nr:MAG: 50S ribosomal protein L13 [Candidatus Berkelbacteria bacterium CG10_big_fil_rev_8_21_14_0_10_43_14]
MKTTMHFNHTHEHHTIDASGQILGRFATNIANLLRGKNKPTFSHHIDCGDFVTVLNSDKISVTGDKLNQKMYRHHTGYIGHLKEISLGDYLQKNHTAVVRLAVLGMLPNNRLRSIWIKRLRFNQSGVENKESQ